MRAFLKSIYLFAKQRSYIPAPDWKQDDETNLRLFMQTPTGKKLHATLVNSSFEQDRWATLQSRNVEHAAGFACGWRSCIAHFESLTGAPPDEEQHETEASKGAESLEHLHP